MKHETTSVGVDLGGTKVAAALFNAHGDMLLKKKSDVSASAGREVAQKIISLLAEVIEGSKSLGLHPGAIGICVPGIAYRNGEVWAPNINGWEKYPIKTEIETYFNHAYTVQVESDRACHMMGECWKGAAIGCTDAIFLAVGTGIGAGILSDGRIVKGGHDISGSIGWMALQPPYRNAYRQRGCFESHASGFGITARAKQLIAEGRESMLNSGVSQFTTEEVFAAFDQRDPVAGQVIGEAVQFWGMAAANLVSLFDPQKIIFGGGVFGPAVKLIDRIYGEAKQWAQPISMKEVIFEQSILGGNAGLIGAGYLALKTTDPDNF